MRATDVIGAEDVARAASEVEAHSGAGTLGGFAFDILSRQAEGRTLHAGKHVEARAEEHGITRDDAETERGNVLEILSRGPKNAAERALVAAFAVRGLGARLTDEDDASALSSFVRHADWLETATPYAVYAFVDRVLEADAATRVWNAVADACVGTRPSTVDHEARGTAAVRVAALEGSKSEAAVDGLSRVARHATDPAVRASAAFALGEPADGAGDESAAVRIAGRLGRTRGGALRELIRVLSGWAAAAWVVRLVTTLLGVERPVEATLVPGGIEVRGRVTLLGRVVREQNELVPVTGLARLTRDVRYPALHLLVGLAALSVGILAGGALTFDAVRGGGTWLFMIGASVILLGAGLDLALDVLVPARRKRVAVEVASAAGPTRRIEGVQPESAEQFIAAVKKVL